MRRFFATTAFVLLFTPAFPQAANHALPGLREFLQHDALGGGPLDPTARYIAAPIRFNTRTEGVIVYVEGLDWCGSGGGPMLVLTRQRSSYKIITKTTVTQLPIRKLKTAHNGMPDLAVTVAGGGIIQGYEVALHFNGKKYPSNPTLVKEEKKLIQGDTLITNESPTVDLYP